MEFSYGPKAMSETQEVEQVRFVDLFLKAAMFGCGFQAMHGSVVGVLNSYWVESEGQFIREITRSAYDDGASH